MRCDGSSLGYEIILSDDLCGLTLPLLSLMILDLHAMLELLDLYALDFLRGQRHEVHFY